MSWIFESLSIIATGGVIWLTWRQKQLNARLIEIEESREEDRLRDRKSAQLRAGFLPTTQSGSYRLVIENIGEVRAEDVRVFLADTPVLEHDRVFSEGPAPGFSVGPGSNITFSIGIGLNTDRPPWELRCVWSDEYDTDRSYETTLTQP